MPTWGYPLLFGGLIGLIFGYFVAGKSARQKPITGGSIAQALHYLAASAFVATAPTVFIAAVFYRLGLVRDLLLALALILTSAILMIAFATVEATDTPISTPPTSQPKF